jgi:hypothetical protein
MVSCTYCRAILALPDDFARFFVQRHNGSFRAARSANDFAVIDEHGFGVSPARLLPAETGHRFLPNHFAIRGGRAEQIATTAQAIDELTVDGRSAARAVAPIVLKDIPDFRIPQLLSVLDINGEQPFRAVASAHRVKAALYNGEPRVTQAGFFEEPKLFGTVGRPALQQSGLFGEIIAVRAAPLRPIRMNRGSEQGNQPEAGQERGEGRFQEGLFHCAINLVAL